MEDGERERERERENRVYMYVRVFGGSTSERARVIVVEREVETSDRLLDNQTAVLAKRKPREKPTLVGG